MEQELVDLRVQVADLRGRVATELSLRETAQDIMQLTQPNNLAGFLEACHEEFSLAFIADTVTQGDTTWPASRLCPQRIVPWDDFSQHQDSIWEKLSSSSLFTSQQVYPSLNELSHVRSSLHPIDSEMVLRHHACNTVENPVQTVVNMIYQDQQLRERLQLRGQPIFESHSSLGQSVVQEPGDRILTSDPSYLGTMEPPASSRVSRDITWGTRQGIIAAADEFCIYELADGQRIPVVLIQYIVPHKLPVVDIVAGLTGEIRPAEDIIHQERNEGGYLTKSLLAVAITKLFSSMIGKGVQRGYIFTGEAIVFLFIPNDTSTVQFYLSVPSLDFETGDNNRIHRTSVAQIIGFVLDAFASEPPSQSWHDSTAFLNTWRFDYSEVFRKIEQKLRTARGRCIYTPQDWTSSSQSPIRTRAQARLLALASDDNTSHQVDRSHDDDNVPRAGSSSHSEERGTKEQDDMEARPRSRFDNQPYCTQLCLLGLASAGALDDRCPNRRDHGGEHLELEVFLNRVRLQLTHDRGPGAECQPLFVKGSRGALVKVRLSSHGYTFVAKAMKELDRPHFLDEATVYDRLKSLQGGLIPVCLGMVDLDIPFYYDYGVYISMLILSWSGRPLLQHINDDNVTRVLSRVVEVLTALHGHQILHKDPECRNWLWDEKNDNIMLVDFERAEILDQSPLGRLNLSRKRDQYGEIKLDEAFDREIRVAKNCISRIVRLRSTEQQSS